MYKCMLKDLNTTDFLKLKLLGKINSELGVFTRESSYKKFIHTNETDEIIITNGEDFFRVYILEDESGCYLGLDSSKAYIFIDYGVDSFNVKGKVSFISDPIKKINDNNPSITMYIKDFYTGGKHTTFKSVDYLYLTEKDLHNGSYPARLSIAIGYKFKNDIKWNSLSFRYQKDISFYWTQTLTKCEDLRFNIISGTIEEW